MKKKCSVGVRLIIYFISLVNLSKFFAAITLYASAFSCTVKAWTNRGVIIMHSRIAFKSISRFSNIYKVY